MNRQRRRAEKKSPSGGKKDFWAHFSLGNALAQQGRLDEAASCFRAALALKPDSPEAHYNLGNALRGQKRLDEAAACFRAAIALKADFADAKNNLGAVLEAMGRPGEAIAAFRAALAPRPEDPVRHYNLGNALRAAGRLDEAIAAFRAAIALNAAFPEAHNNLANALREQGHIDAAVTSLRAALALKPDFAQAHSNLGNALRELGDFDDAVASCRAALALTPDDAGAHLNLAMALLSRGDFSEGWAEYEWRFETPHLRAARRAFPSIPQWRGEPAAGKLLLIHAEQGFGDTIQFCRYAPLAVARGLRVILEVPKPLVRLLQDSLPRVDRVIAHGDCLAGTKIDFHCPMLSLPLAFATTLETIPAGGEKNYLRADPARIAGWKDRRAGGGKKCVGLVWAGNPRRHSRDLASIDRRRSIAPELLAPLFDVPGITFVSLQQGGPPAPEEFPLFHAMDEMNDFADTAALIATLDLVISVDTAVAHLAAALGRPVWLLDRFDSCWRWLAGRRDSPWYPTLRRYRQPRLGDWAPVVAEVALDLRGVAA